MTARTSNSADRYCVHYKLFFWCIVLEDQYCNYSWN